MSPRRIGDIGRESRPGQQVYGDKNMEDVIHGTGPIPASSINIAPNLGTRDQAQTDENRRDARRLRWHVQFPASRSYTIQFGIQARFMNASPFPCKIPRISALE